MTAIIDGTRAPAPLAGPSTEVGISADRIHNLYRTRKNKNIKVIQAGERIRRVYNGEWDTVLPELESRERTQVANLILSGIDQHALRISSVMPNISFPPERNSRAARDRASDRRQVIEAWHYENKMGLKFRRRSRHLISYATTPVYIRPGKDMVPVWEVWDPLNTFPAPSAPDDYVPSDVIYSFKRSWRWLQDTYNLGARLPLGDNKSPDGMIDCLLYCDDTEMVMVALGTDTNGEALPALTLQRVPNLAGRPCVIVPGRITLDRLQGQFDQMIGMYEAQGLIWAMHLQALKRSIFAETWLEGRPNESPTVVTPANALTGQIGVVEGGQLATYRADPSVQTGQSLDRIERNERLSGGVPADFGGESASNIRTGRRGQQVLSSAIDFQIQEHQDILAASLEAENKAAIAIAKAYWPSTEKTMLVPFGDGQVTYIPEQTFPVDTHRVAYVFSGVSADGLVVEGLQRVGAGTLSNQGFMEIDPLITDPMFEHQRIVAEGIEKALLASIQQQASDPNSPYQPADIAWLMTTITDKKVDLATAITQLHERIQKAQAAAAQGQASPEQMQPGLAMPGAPGTPQAAQPIPQTGQPAPSQEGLASLMGALRNVQRGVPAQAGA